MLFVQNTLPFMFTSDIIYYKFANKGAVVSIHYVHHMTSVGLAQARPNKCFQYTSSE